MKPIKVINIDDMVKTFYTESDFIQYVNIIIKENEDNCTVNSVLTAKHYINSYCANLMFID